MQLTETRLHRPKKAKQITPFAPAVCTKCARARLRFSNVAQNENVRERTKEIEHNMLF